MLRRSSTPHGHLSANLIAGLLVLVLASLGKLGAGYLAARLAGRSHPEAVALGYRMNTRALMELVVLNVGPRAGISLPAQA